ncbi:MAG: hypothetical protein KatS3mg032_2563 [Cyclobacteriaceae bacterium]|nr:MAG: hypothetical protein KatS3mg032_2563 [Cyclobacteriaceae bacterium]
MYLIYAGVACFTAQANTITGKVTEVIDGNTLIIKSTQGADKATYRIILLDIDSPDPGQSFAEEARSHVEKLLRGKTITCTITGKDRHGNYLGIVYGKAGKDLRFELVSYGLAWVAEKCTEPELHRLQQQAQEKKLGLWTEQSPIPPWIYRRQQSMLTPKSS